MCVCMRAFSENHFTSIKLIQMIDYIINGVSQQEWQLYFFHTFVIIYFNIVSSRIKN